MEAKHANPFLSSVSNVLQMVVGVQATKGEVKKGEGINTDKLYTMYFRLETGLEGFYERNW
jgi:CheY-specific phosphatase CheX